MFTITADDHATELVLGMQMTVGDVMETLIRETSEVMTPFLEQEAPIGRHYGFDGSLQMGGQLRDSLNWNVGPYGATLQGAKQGEYVIGGTRPHVIRPRVKQRLAFFWPKVGRGVTFGMVHHPGTDANDFRQKAIQQAFDEMAIQDVTERIMTEWIAGGAV